MTVLIVFCWASPSWGELEPGDILVADYASGTIRQFSSSGVDLGVFASVLTIPGAQLVLPFSVAVDSNMNVYLSTISGVPVQSDIYGEPWNGSYGDGIIKFSPTGERVMQSSFAIQPNYRTNAGIAVAPDGRIIVGDYSSGYRPWILQQDGRIIGILGDERLPFSSMALLRLGIDNDVWITGQGGHASEIVHVSLETEAVSHFTVAPVVGGVDGLAISKNGILYVGNRGTPDANGVRPELTIDRWSPTGDFLGTFIHTGVAGTDYWFDIALDFDAEGNLYVLNHLTGELRKFSPKGRDLGIIASGFGPLGDVVVVRGGPTTKEECKHGGWKSFEVPRAFKNQGDCIQFVNTGK